MIRLKMVLIEDIVVNNIVMSFKLNDKLDRVKVKESFPSVDYPKRFSGGILKLDGGCLLIFNSGKINVTGVKSYEAAFNLIDKFCDIYPDNLYKTEAKVVNIVAHSRLITNFIYSRLDSFPYCSYEPELFPGVHVKVDNSNVIFIIFKRTGRVTVTGIRDIIELNKYFDLFKRIYKR